MIDSIKALKDGLLDGGCLYATNFPGFKSHDIFNALDPDGKSSLNEKIAYEMAYGASLAGKRSVVTMKNVGLNVAADPFLNSLITGVNAGLILVVTDDLDIEGSQLRQDSRHYFNFFGGLWFEPESTQAAYDIGYQSFSLSERLDTPVVIRLTNDFFHLSGEYTRHRKKKSLIYKVPKLEKFVMHPTTWRKHQKNLINKNRKIQKFVESRYQCNLIKRDKKTRVISIGSCESRLLKLQKKNNIRSIDVLRINTYPLPLKAINNFVENSKKTFIVENGDGFVKRHLLSLIKNRKIIFYDKQKLFNGKYIIWDKLEKLFTGIKNNKVDYVIGDMGRPTRETKGVINCCLSLGSSISIAMGINLSSGLYPVCVIGDGAFGHGGLLSLTEAFQRRASLCVIIIDNGGMLSTGGQKIAMQIYSLNIKARKLILDYSKTTTHQFQKIIASAKRKKELLLIYIKA